MSEEAQKPLRTAKDVALESNQLIYKCGQLQNVLYSTQKDLTTLNDRIRDLSLEFVQLTEKEKEIAKRVSEEAAKATAAATPQNPPNDAGAPAAAEVTPKQE